MATKKTKPAVRVDRAIKAGDVVQLKSGGPKMTVGRIGANNDNRLVAFCAWFDPRLDPFSYLPKDSVVEAVSHVHQDELEIAALMRVMG